MNTYHDNLSQTIIDLLQQRGIEYDGLSSKLIAAETNLHYATEAVIATTGIHKQLVAELDEHMNLVQRAEHVKLLGYNENQRATGAALYMKQAVVNAAICAANMQITANSVVKLASDVASAWSIVNAIDADSEIYRLATEAKDLVNTVAYDAELASLLGMDVSMRAAEVPAAELANRSKETLNPLYNATVQAVDVAKPAVAQAEAAMAAAIGNQNTIHAMRDTLTTRVQAAKESYAFAGKVLNEDIEVEQASRVAASGIMVAKKTEINALVRDIQKLQYEVDEAQARVDGLTQRSTWCGEALAATDARRAAALNNKTLCEGFAQAVNMLMQNSAITHTEVKEADKTTRQLAIQFKPAVDKLIHAADVINKLASLIVRKKALNPLISDDLIQIITTAGNEANNSVSMALVALRSVFEAETSNRAACREIEAESLFATSLYKAVADEEGKSAEQRQLLEIYREIYHKTNASYKQTLEANDVATKELNNATTELNKLQLKLKTLQAGLAAANAATLAT